MKHFFDTNILIYAFDKSDPVKNKKAKELIEENLKNDTFIVSSQVVQEFCNGALRKFKRQIPVNELNEFLNQVLLPNCHHYPDPDFYLAALRLFQVNSISYYDGLIIQAAIDSGCTKLFSEDLAHNQQFGGSLTVIDPFRH